MSLKDKIRQDISEALKGRDEQRVSTLRFLSAQIKDREIEQGRKELTDEEIVKLISGQIKKLQQSLSLFEKGKREDLVEKTKTETELLKGYLPEQLSDEELEKEIEAVIVENPSVVQPGALIGICVKKLAGRVDNKKIAQVVMRKLKIRYNNKYGSRSRSSSFL